MEIEERRQKVAASLQEVVDKIINVIEEREFDYQTWVTERSEGCGTICCIAGWMPKYMPNVGLKWNPNPDGRDMRIDDEKEPAFLSQIYARLMTYHGCSQKLVDQLYTNVSFLRTEKGPSLEDVRYLWMNVIHDIKEGNRDIELY